MNFVFSVFIKIMLRRCSLDALASKDNSGFFISEFRKLFAVSVLPHVKSIHLWEHKVSAFYSKFYHALMLFHNSHSLNSEISYEKSLDLERRWISLSLKTGYFILINQNSSQLCNTHSLSDTFSPFLCVIKFCELELVLAVTNWINVWMKLF